MTGAARRRKIPPNGNRRKRERASHALLPHPAEVFKERQPLRLIGEAPFVNQDAAGDISIEHRLFDAIEAHTGGRKVFLMVSVGEGTTMSNEARALASSEEASRYIAADAIVVRDFGHQLAANVFVRHHRPPRPIQMFPDKESALKWLEQQRITIGKNGSS